MTHLVGIVNADGQFVPGLAKDDERRACDECDRCSAHARNLTWVVYQVADGERECDWVEVHRREKL